MYSSVILTFPYLNEIKIAFYNSSEQKAETKAMEWKTVATVEGREIFPRLTHLAHSAALSA